MAPMPPKHNNNHNHRSFASADMSSTLYSRIREMQPLELLQRLEKESINTRGDMPGLRARLLRHELRKHYPESCAALHKDLELSGKEAESWCATMHLWEIDMRTKMRTRELQERRDSMKKSMLEEAVDRKSDETNIMKQLFENNIIEKSRVDYLLSCVTLLKTWGLQYSGAKGQIAKDFLDNLRDFRKFSEINDDVLLLMLPCIFGIDAKIWYRLNNFTSWDEFETTFIQDSAIGTKSRVSPMLKTNLVPKVSQSPTHFALPNSKTDVEARMSQNFSFGLPDALASRDAHKLQGSDQEQPRPKPPSTHLTEKEQLRQLELIYDQTRARFLGPTKNQTQLNFMKERTPPPPVAVTTQTDVVGKSAEEKQPPKPIRVDKSTKTVPTLHQNHVECVKLLRLWKLKYSGEKGQTVIEFIDDLNDFRKYTDVSDDVLLDVLACVLYGDAKRWFRDPLNKKWSTWEDFKGEFLERFYGPEAAKETLKSIVSNLKQL